MDQAQVLPPLLSIENNGIRYFDQEWLRRAREIVKSKGVRDEVVG